MKKFSGFGTQICNPTHSDIPLFGHSARAVQGTWAKFSQRCRSPSQKIRTQDLCLLGKKKGVDPSFRTLFWKKTFFFGWRQGSAPLHYGFASVPLRSAPAANQKKFFFPKQRSKLGQLLFFFPTGKDPKYSTNFCDVYKYQFKICLRPMLLGFLPLQRKSHYNYRDDFALEKFEKVKILVYHICPKNG